MVKSNISHYRPISSLTLFSKIFEQIIITRLTQYLDYTQTLVEFGFRNKSSTDSATYKLLNDTLTSLNSKLIVGGIFCDLQKAFDCVNDDILLLKLNFYGIIGLVNKLLESYLKNWFQRVIIDNKLRHISPNGSKLVMMFHKAPYLVSCFSDCILMISQSPF